MFISSTLAVGLYFIKATEKQTGTEVDTRVWSRFDGPSCLILGEDCGSVWNWGLTKQLGAQSLVSSCGSLKVRALGEREQGRPGLWSFGWKQTLWVIF